MQPYNRFTGEGTGFSFANFNAYELAETVRRALALYHNEHDAYLRVQRQAMAQDFSFTRSAEDYAHLYLLLLPEDTAPKHDAGDEAFRRPLGALETGAAVRLAFTDTESFVFDAAVELYGDAYSDTVAMAQTAAGFAASVTVPAAPRRCATVSASRAATAGSATSAPRRTDGMPAFVTSRRTAGG